MSCTKFVQIYIPHLREFIVVSECLLQHIYNNSLDVVDHIKCTMKETHFKQKEYEYIIIYCLYMKKIEIIHKIIEIMSEKFRRHQMNKLVFRDIRCTIEDNDVVKLKALGYEL